MNAPLHNRDVDWDQWPVSDYLAEVYHEVLPADDAVLLHHSAFYRGFEPGHSARSLELGAGPNLYPLMLAAAVSREIEAVEPSAASVAYLDRQLTDGPDPSWQRFYERCRRLQPALPATLAESAVAGAGAPGRRRRPRPAGYDLASMHFVAESATEDLDEFREICHAFVRGGRGWEGAWWPRSWRTWAATGSAPARTGPATRSTPGSSGAVFAPLTTDLRISRVDSDATSARLRDHRHGAAHRAARRGLIAGPDRSVRATTAAHPRHTAVTPSSSTG